jgi:L-lysine exporter family protein LysE/ArgO
MSSTFSVFIQGFATCAALIIAIGAQNAFVLRQGIKREHVFVIALMCSVSDALLVSLGVAGLGTLVQQSPTLLAIARYGGATFLFVYGAMAARRALRASNASLDIASGANGIKATSLKTAIASCLAFTYLNPHCYLDTVVLMGSLSAQFSGASRWVFAVGAVSASFVWFFSLAYGARLLAPLFAKPNAWRILDAVIACVMWAIALSLLIQ